MKTSAEFVRRDPDVEFGGNSGLGFLSESVSKFVISEKAQYAFGEFVPLGRREQQSRVVLFD